MMKKEVGREGCLDASCMEDYGRRYIRGVFGRLRGCYLRASVDKGTTIEVDLAES